MPFPIDVTRCLAFCETNAPLRISTIPFDALRAAMAERGLREGDEIIVEALTDGHVLATKRDGRRVVVERKHAVMIEVERRTPLPSPWRIAVRPARIAPASGAPRPKPGSDALRCRQSSR